MLRQPLITNSQLSINAQLPIINEAVAAVCKLLNVNSMKIETCKLKLEPTPGVVL
jgi:hypothetical protein